MANGESGWDGNQAGQRVRLVGNPGRQGTTTGRTKQTGSFLMVEVDFGPNDRKYQRYNLLEPVDSAPDMHALLASGRFGGPIDLRRILTLAKVRGDLTNVFYSMESSNTRFYAHQFKPVLKFVESTTGRLLIADEVGLGKTIESVYIWKELQARANARRLLVVCPAMLREKWRDDLAQRFDIIAEIVAADGLIKNIEQATQRPRHSFTLIASLEGLRTPFDYHSDRDTSSKAELARILDRNNASEDFALFDLVIIDEAHYLRNPGTASNRLGRLLRDAARNLVLLTATPIQIDSDNLYQLLRLIDEDQFFQAESFKEMLRANVPIVRALSSLWRAPPDLAAAAANVESAIETPYFGDDQALRKLGNRISSIPIEDRQTRVEIARALESRSLLGQYMTRSRKRQVLERNVVRDPRVLRVSFDDLERKCYDMITRRIRDQIAHTQGVASFSLCMRQRQMASSIVAALEHWRDTELLEELLWEDVGLSLTEDEELSFGDIGSIENIVTHLPDLEKQDSKYHQLRRYLAGQLGSYPRDKIVIFSFFRRTLEFLRRRLRADGIRVEAIMGGMGDEKFKVLSSFARHGGPSVLLSSEIGSEGIDLQFCRHLVNYDLPWNPMKVEQRIGRLDRLGQRAEKISIVNIALEDTVEDRILLRLYDRIELFKDSVGDIEEILGEETRDLFSKLFSPDLTDEQRVQLAEQSAAAIINRRAIQERLETEAVNLVGFEDYIRDSVNEARDQGRWLNAEELMALVYDFFESQYPGTKIERDHERSWQARIDLSLEARRDLAAFVRDYRGAAETRVHQSAVTCVFDPRMAHELEHGTEIIQPTHALVQWIREWYDVDDMGPHAVSSAQLLRRDRVTAPAGRYAFAAWRWEFNGIRAERVLKCRAVNVDSGRVLDWGESEALVNAAAREGQPWRNVANAMDIGSIRKAVECCEQALGDGFDRYTSEFQAENDRRCNGQRTSAERYTKRRIRELDDRLHRFRSENRRRLLPMTEGLVRKERSELNTKLARIETRREVDSSFAELAIGVIRLTEDA